MDSIMRYSHVIASLGTLKMFRLTLLIWITTIFAGNIAATFFFYMNNGHGLLDFAGYANIPLLADPWPTPSESYAHLKAYTTTGLTLYYPFLLIDLFIPLTGGLFFASAYSYFYMTEHISRRFFSVAILSPLLFVAADYLENISIFTMLIQLPNEVPALAILTTIFLTIKFSISFLNCFIIFGVYIYHRFWKNP